MCHFGLTTECESKSWILSKKTVHSRQLSHCKIVYKSFLILSLSLNSHSNVPIESIVSYIWLMLLCNNWNNKLGLTFAKLSLGHLDGKLLKFGQFKDSEVLQSYFLDFRIGPFHPECHQRKFLFVWMMYEALS